MGSELESTGNDSISSNWILVGQFRSVETKIKVVFVVDLLKAHKTNRIVLTVLCLWSLGLDLWSYGAPFAYVPILCVYMCTYLCVPVGVDASVPV